METTQFADIIRGDSYFNTLTFRDEYGDAIDITGAKVWFTLKSSPDDLDADAIIQKTVDPTDPTAGEAEVNLTAAETALFVPGKYYYDFQLVEADGTVTSFMVGNTLRVIEDITRSIA